MIFKTYNLPPQIIVEPKTNYSGSKAKEKEKEKLRKFAFN